MFLAVTSRPPGTLSRAGFDSAAGRRALHRAMAATCSNTASARVASTSNRNATTVANITSSGAVRGNNRSHGIRPSTHRRRSTAHWGSASSAGASSRSRPEASSSHTFVCARSATFATVSRSFRPKLCVDRHWSPSW